MGFPMAGHLAAAGHKMTVFNRNSKKGKLGRQTWRPGAAASPMEAAKDADFVFMCVGADHDVREVLDGPQGAFKGMKKGAVVIDHTTTSAVVSREMAERGAKDGIHFLDAPVSGGQAGAEKGQLTVMVGGEAAAYERAEPLIRSFAKQCRLMGPVGAWQITKMISQICIAGVVQGLAEGLAFCGKVRPRSQCSGRGDLERCRTNPGRWKTAIRPWRRVNSISVSPSIGCARISASAWTEARRKRRQIADDRTGRPILCRHSGHGRQSL